MKTSPFSSRFWVRLPLISTVAVSSRPVIRIETVADEGERACTGYLEFNPAEKLEIDP